MGSVSRQKSQIDVGAIVDTIIQAMTAGNIEITSQLFPGYAVVRGVHPTHGILEYTISPQGVIGPSPAEEFGHKTSIDAVRANIGDEMYLRDMEYDPTANKFVPL